jgi:transcriptional regulator with XRE-family HTH domain
VTAHPDPSSAAPRRAARSAPAGRAKTALPKAPTRSVGAAGTPPPAPKRGAPTGTRPGRTAARAVQPVDTPAPRSVRATPEGTDPGSAQLGQVIASQVRSRRQEIGLTVGQLAERTGISKGMLSKIENAQSSPSLSTVERLAAALDIPVTSLFRGLAEERDAVFVKAGTGPEIVRRGTRAGHTYVLLGSLRGPYKRMEPLLVSLDKSSEVFPLFQHPGVEMLYMLDGVMEYTYGRERYRMERGDTLQFEGDIPHGPTQLVKTPIRFLSIIVYAGDR